ncbi:MAG: DJ-1/PfpI family protein [Thiofilum sp.]|nr:DJ-1/PfpI family protein [Thiofilum sp.]
MAGTLGMLLAGVGSRLWAAESDKATPAVVPEAPKVDHQSNHNLSMMPADWTKPDQIAMLIYPEFTALDLIGPHYMFAGLMGATVHIVAATREPVTSDTKVTIVPTATYDEVPQDLTVLFIPGGGESVIRALEDEKLMAFVRDRGSRAKYVTSTCTGSLILAGAGLLQGYKATSHWVAREALVAGGATPVNERVVRDRNRITGAGVTAGIDLGLSLIAELRDTFYAQNMQLLAEYAPQPPFNAGTPETAPKEAVQLMSKMFTGYNDKAQAAIKKALG